MKPTIKFGFAVALLCLFGCSTPSVPFKPQPQKPTMASAKGRIFLITMGGDLKPARMATVYVLPPDAVPNADLLGKKEAAVKNRLDYVESYRSAPDIHTTYRNGEVIREYETALNALEATIQSSAVSKGFVLSADEDGAFTLTLNPNTYLIVAFGQAGVNKGYWLSELQLSPGDQKELKMGSPAAASSVLF